MTSGDEFEFEHRYGPNVRLLSDPYLLLLLARVGQPDNRPPGLLQLLRSFYVVLTARMAARELAATELEVDTRMREQTEAGVWRGRAVDPQSRVVIANVMRAGNVPSLTVFEELAAVLDPGAARVDHFYFSREAGEDGRVTGVNEHGSKVGGDVEGSIVVLPDPMGATGSTTLQTIEAYRRLELGRPARFVAMHMIITPEYVRRVKSECDDDVVIYAGRVDRGASDPEILATVPGTHIERESGLTEQDYIVPGAGGLGEVINNAFC